MVTERILEHLVAPLVVCLTLGFCRVELRIVSSGLVDPACDSLFFSLCLSCLWSLSLKSINPSLKNKQRNHPPSYCVSDGVWGRSYRRLAFLVLSTRCPGKSCSSVSGDKDTEVWIYFGYIT